jgi:hypothetical protein
MSKLIIRWKISLLERLSAKKEVEMKGPPELTRGPFLIPYEEVRAQLIDVAVTH